MKNLTIPEWAPDDPRRTPVALRKELITLGYNDRALGRLTQDGVLAKPRRGAYCDGPRYRSLDDSGKHAIRTRAAIKQAGTEVVVSHVSAVPEYEAPTWGLDLSDVNLTREDGKTGRREAGIQQHRGKILEGDVVTRNGIKVMSGTRTALEVSLVASVEAALAVMCHMLRFGFTTLEALAERYDQSIGRWPFSLKTEIVLRLADPRFESVGEVRTFFLCFRHGVPLPQPQYEIHDLLGRLVARVDFAWPDLKVFLEFDGRIKYQKLLKPGENPTDVVLREKEREKMIKRLTGWRCLRITWADLEHPERTAARILAELADLTAA